MSIVALRIRNRFSVYMEVVRIQWVLKRQSRRVAAQEEGSTTELRRSSSTQTSYDHRSRKSSTQTSRKNRARGGAHEDEEGGGEGEDREEEAQEQQHRQQRGNGPKPSLPNVAAHFERLVNVIQKRTEEEGTRDKLYNEFIKNCKQKIIGSLKSTYIGLDYFYINPSERMPECLSESPPAETVYTDSMDMRLSGKESQIQQDLRLFVEEIGFVCLYVNCLEWTTSTCFKVRLRLDVATVSTAGAKTSVGNRLLALEAFRSENF